MLIQFSIAFRFTSYLIFTNLRRITSIYEHHLANRIKSIRIRSLPRVLCTLNQFILVIPFPPPLQQDFISLIKTWYEVWSLRGIRCLQFDDTQIIIVIERATVRSLSSKLKRFSHTARVIIHKVLRNAASPLKNYQQK